MLSQSVVRCDQFVQRLPVLKDRVRDTLIGIRIADPKILEHPEVGRAEAGVRFGTMDSVTFS